MLHKSSLNTALLFLIGVFALAINTKGQDTLSHTKGFRIEKNYPCILKLAGKTPRMDSAHLELGARTDTITISELISAGGISFSGCKTYQVISYTMTIHSSRGSKKYQANEANFTNEMINDIKSLNFEQINPWISIDNITYKDRDNSLRFIDERHGFTLIIYKL